MEKIKAECPFCDKIPTWGLSATGKHYHAHCEDHGFIAAVRNPILPAVTIRVYPKQNILSRAMSWCMGEF